MRRMAFGSVLVAILVAFLALSRGWADGIADDPLYYSGVIEEAGSPVDGTRNLEVNLWDDPSDPDETHRVCATRRDEVPIEAGRFRLALDSGCVAAIKTNPELWVELRVGGESLGRTVVGAVPYAVESSRASDASGALRETIDTLAPPGVVSAFAGPRPPTGWLLCDGAEVSRAEYADLFAAIGTAHGEGDGATTFNLPDYRGRFLRGVDSGVGRDTDAPARLAASPGGNVGDDIGTVEGFATALPQTPFIAESAGSHTHTYDRENDSTAYDGTSQPANIGSSARDTSAAGAHTHTLAGGDAETRPQNAAVIYIIRH
jgi:microcystin-dependent protein